MKLSLRYEPIGPASRTLGTYKRVGDIGRHRLLGMLICVAAGAVLMVDALFWLRPPEFAVFASACMAGGVVTVAFWRGEQLRPLPVRLPPVADRPGSRRRT